MTKLTFDLENVAIKSQGHEAMIDVARLPESSLVAAMVYGLRRIVQDSVNSEAKTLRDAGSAVDGAALTEARLQAMYDGTLGVRVNAGMTDVERVIVQIATKELGAMIAEKKGKDAAKAFRALGDAETKTRVEAYIAQHDGRDWAADAEAEIARRKAAAEARAKAIAQALSAVAKADIDLDAILNG